MSTERRRFDTHINPAEKFPTIRANGSTTSNWPLKLTYRATNKNVVAAARAEQLNIALSVLAERIKDPTLDAATLVSLTDNFVELQKQYQRLQERFYIGDGRSYKKNRWKKKKDGSVNHLLK
jgi:hypothetical protein